jgi:hypothetical protein
MIRIALHPRLAGILLFGLFTFVSHAAEFHVSPIGKPKHNGSSDKPWDLATALSQPREVKSGDTIWLHGGTYRGAFYSKLKGTKNRPILVRQFPGEQATIDCCDPLDPKNSGSFRIDGEHAWFWGFEITCSDKTRSTSARGSNASDIQRGGLNCRGSNIKMINLVVHDTQGCGLWSDGEGGELYGCVIYNNGWKGPDRGHGHAIYAQNKTGTKRILDNIFFNQFAYGLHIYGSEKSALQGFDIQGNVAFNNGCLSAPGERSPNLLVGGGSPADRITVVSNFTYHPGQALTARFGYGAVNEELVCRNNYFVGQTFIQLWKTITMTGNTFVSSNTLVHLAVPGSYALSTYNWDNNTYLCGEENPDNLTIKGGPLTSIQGWSQWRKKGDLDPRGKFSMGRPRGSQVFVRGNSYEPGRGHLIVYNWDRKPAVEADLSTLLKPAQGFRIVRAQDYFGDAVFEGHYSGKPISLPMSHKAGVRPIGMDDFQPPVTAPEFEVFVVLPK